MASVEQRVKQLERRRLVQTDSVALAFLNNGESTAQAVARAKLNDWTGSIVFIEFVEPPVHSDDEVAAVGSAKGDQSV